MHEQVSQDVFEPIIKRNFSFAEKGKNDTHIQLSHSLSLVIQQNEASFHFGGSMKELVYESDGKLKSDFKRMRTRLPAYLRDIKLGLANLLLLVKEKKITLPERISASTFNPFLARLYRGLPETVADVKLFWPREGLAVGRLEIVTVLESELKELLEELPLGLERNIYYRFTMNTKEPVDRETVLKKFIDEILSPRIEQMLAKLKLKANLNDSAVGLQ